MAGCPVLPFSAVEAHVYARLYVDLRTRGALIGERDLQIAATAIAGDHDLLTHDLGDFANASPPVGGHPPVAERPPATSPFGPFRAASPGWTLHPSLDREAGMPYDTNAYITFAALIIPATIYIAAIVLAIRKLG